LSIIAYTISSDFNGSRMLGHETERTNALFDFYSWRYMLHGVPHPATCTMCYRKTDAEYFDRNFRVNKRSWDFGSTYDGYEIVSHRFRDFCKRLRLTGLRFVRLPADPTFYWLRVLRVLAFDAKRRGTRFQQFCPQCKAYCWVTGATPARLLGVTGPIAKGLYRSDIEFACSHEQHPLLFVDTKTAEAIRREKFRKIVLKPVEA
jgi:hypothetical protein